MSVLDEIRAVEERVARRLQELEPLVAEYHELQQVARRLGLETGRAQDGAASAPRPWTTAPTASAPPRPPKARRDATGRQEAVLSLVREHPGIPVTELSRRLEVAPTSLYRVVRRLERQGHLKKTGTTIQPA